jgi:Na+-transporting NADH:ubiquinone oxidoreductase subunit E
MAGIRMKLRFATIPQPLEGIGITLISIAIMAMGFMGFAGFIRL